MLCGGQVKKIKPLVLFEEGEAALKPLMEEFYKIPERNIRKQLANQFCGRLGRKTWQYACEVVGLEELGAYKGPIRRSRYYGAFALIETFRTKKTTNKTENLAWAWATAARARIEVHKLIMELKKQGARIYMVNADELIVEKNTLKPQWLRENNKNFKKRTISETYLSALKAMQFDVVYKRQQDARNKSGRRPWHNIAH
jgi:hypothetical protein